MKILFAVNNDNISDAIVKKYQKEYKEILSYKNVYYFNAILRELQKDKSYNRIVIGEDLEPFANNNYDSIDNFLFEKYSNISEEAKDVNNDKIDIIIICADRRKKTDSMLAKIYNKDIYNAIIGQDRSIDEVCRLINMPRDKEEAKAYYGIRESELSDTESENSVSEAEVENIRLHYARLGKNEDKYVESFNNIVSQYTDTQLKIIIKYLPMNVKAVLETKSPKYQQLVMNSEIKGFDAKKQTVKYKEQIKEKSNKKEEESLVEQLIKPKNIKSVVIPTNLSTKNAQKVIVPDINKPKITKPDSDKKIVLKENIIENNEKQENNEEVQQPKRGRGRPRKNPVTEIQEQKPKRGRGRPRKNLVEQKDVVENNEKDIEKVENKEVDLFKMVQEVPVVEKPEIDLFNLEEIPEIEKPEVDLFDFEEDIQEDSPENEQEVSLFDEEEQIDKNEPELFNFEEEIEDESEVDLFNNIESSYEEEDNKHESNDIVRTSSIDTNLNTLLTADKKIVAFVGTTKNGTSFIVNNTAEMLSTMGIDTAILDMTKTKNAYYIYTNNEEYLRETARKCMNNLQEGVAEGIKVNKHLTIYTEMPGEEEEYEIDVVLKTLLSKYSAVLIDTDFDTASEIFEKAQEIYLVQSMDVLTIQPLTAFLRNLKSKNILKPEKLKIIINKAQRVKGLNIKTLIGGMSCYNSPNMTYMTELFNKDNVPYCEIPFEVQNYVKYLSSLVNCSISLDGYTKQFINSLKELANIVYPLVSKQKNNRKGINDPFSSQINDTLNKMKSKY